MQVSGKIVPQCIIASLGHDGGRAQMHAIIRIDEVERLGTPKISDAKGGGNVMPFPMPMPDK